MLSGKTHSVYTGVTFVFIDKAGRTGEHCFYEKTDVSMYTLTEEEIDRYISSGDPMDKAGSYGIQGRFAIHIKGIHGDYNNVVGLPVARLYQELRKLFLIAGPISMAIIIFIRSPGINGNTHIESAPLTVLFASKQNHAVPST